MNNLFQDITTITNIPTSILNKLKDNSIACITHTVLESIENQENMLEIDIGLGVLYIMVDEEEIRYKFVPSVELENSVKNTVLTKESVLIDKVEETLKEKILNVYKELL